MAADTQEPMVQNLGIDEEEEEEEERFQTDNSVSKKIRPKQQLSKSMQHMRFAVTVDPKFHATSSALPSDPAAPGLSENDAYGVPASFAPVRKPACRSHDPANHQKRTDPFAFGSRYLEEGDDIFEFNAWDHVTVDPAYEQFSEEQYAKQRQEPVSDFDRRRYNDQPEKWWDQFYRNNKTNFFKDRKWLTQEFSILEELGRADAPEAVLLEVGAGAGNSAFPILQRCNNKRLRLHACDFSKKAIELIRGHELYDAQVIQADVWDVASPPDSENGGLPPGLAEGSVDVVLMIFIFSALSPTQWDQAVRNVWRVLKPGGQVLFRDYGRGDLAQVRFKKGRYMEENFYIRGDGTRVYFFDQHELEETWGGKTRNTQVGNIADTSSSSGGGELDTSLTEKLSSLDLHDPALQDVHKSNDDVCNPETRRPLFEVVHIGVDRRMLVNRQRRLKMYRSWVQAVFRKAGEESKIATSMLQEHGEEVEEELSANVVEASLMVHL